MRIYGLSYWTEDPDGFNLYVLTRGEETDLKINKINVENGNLAHVRDLDIEGRPGGINITNQFDPFNWVLTSIVGFPDRIVVWQVDGNRDWMQAEPVDGIIQAGESGDVNLLLSSEGVPAVLFEGELVFEHDGVGGETHFPISMNVLEELPPRPPSTFSLLEPENEDTLSTDSVQIFLWEESVDPNPDDVVNYQIWFQVLEEMICFDAQSNSWEVGIDTLLADFDQGASVTWWVKAISDPDTVECNSRFVFHVLPQSAGEINAELPYEFAIQSVHPNPFNSTTSIRYGLDKSAPTRLALYDLSGREVRTLVEGKMQAGYYTTILDAGDLPSGLYFVRLATPQATLVRKVVLVE